MNSTHSTMSSASTPAVHSSLLKKLDVFRQNSEFCDIRFKVGTKYFCCHRVILASVTDFFHALFKPDYIESTQHTIELFDVDESIFEILLDFIYRGELKIEEKNVCSVLAACVYFQLKHGEDLCVNLIKNNLHTVNVFDLYSLPCLRYKRDLNDIVKKFISQNYSRLSKCEEFCVLPFDQLREVLLSAELMIYDIQEIVDSCIKWVCYDIENRSQYLIELTKLANTKFVPPDGLLHLISNISVVNEKEKCLKLFFNGVLHTEKAVNSSSPLEPLFIARKCDQKEDAVLIKFKDRTWVQVGEMAFDSAHPTDIFAEATVLNHTLYLSCGYFSNISVMNADERLAAGIPGTCGVPFYGCDMETKKWQLLYPSSCISHDLIPCNSKIYSYNELSTDFQFFSFIPNLNRWITIPNMNVPRCKAGIASDGRFVYVIGGKPNIDPTPCNMIEFYDERCKNWQTLVSHKKLRMSLLRNRYTKKVCFLDGLLYIFSRRSMEVFDHRANKWRADCEVPEIICNQCSTKRSYLVPMQRELWYISCAQTIYSYDPRVNTWSRGPDGDDYYLKPVQIIRSCI